MICIVLDRAPSCCRQASSGWTAGRVGARHCSLPHPKQRKLKSEQKACFSGVNQSHSAHPAQRGRFARSLTDVILQRTGSDMAAALLSGRFQATAPAALYYYGPTTELLWSRINTVYQWHATHLSGAPLVSPACPLKSGQSPSPGWAALALSRRGIQTH